MAKKLKERIVKSRVGRGEEAKAEAQAQIDATMLDAIEALKDSKTDGFGVFFISKDKKGNSKGVQTIVGGAMGVQDTLHMSSALKAASNELMDALMSNLKELTDED